MPYSENPSPNLGKRSRNDEAHDEAHDEANKLKPSELVGALIKRRRLSSEHEHTKLDKKTGLPECKFNLLALPVDLVYEFMKHLRPSELQAIRTTCYALFWISHHASFRQTLGAAMSTPNKAELKSLLQRDLLCSSCWTTRHVRLSSRLQLRSKVLFDKSHAMWCSGCKKKHPRILFSAAQRQTPEDKRICIGREGYVRLCSHHTFSWSDVEKVNTGVPYHPAYPSPFCAVETRHDMDCLGDGVRGTLTVKQPRRPKDPAIVNITTRLRHCFPAVAPAARSDRDCVRSCARAEYHAVKAALCPHLGEHNLAEYEPGRPIRCRATNCDTEVLCEHYGSPPLAMIMGRQPNISMSIRRSLTFTKPDDPEWVFALDPDSFGMRSDRETDGIAWCSNAACLFHQGHGMRLDLKAEGWVGNWD